MLMNKFRPILIFVFFMCLLGSTTSVQARKVLNIGLTRFEAIPLDNKVRLEWQTETELGTAGYKLKRGQNGSFSYLADASTNDDLFILSEGGPSLGASYAFVDETAINGELYTYQLIEVTVDGSETVQADQTITVGVQPTNTPIVLGGGGGDSNNSSPTPGNTSTPTATAASTNVGSTPLASSTPRPTIIPTQTSPVLASTSPPPTQTVAVVRPTSAPATAAASISDQNNQQTDENPSADPGVGIAQALEENTLSDVSPEAQNPGSPGQESNPVTADMIQSSSNPNTTDPEIAAERDGSQPTVIGITRPLDSGANAEDVVGSQESNPNQGSNPARIYLWVAFIAAMVIFVAAVLSAILLYTRRRKKE